MSNILQEIIAQKKIEVSSLNMPALRHAAEQSPVPRNFLAALHHPANQAVALIAELKRASPSKGILAPDLDLLEIADIYSKNGASAISVLTDEKFFRGKLETLRELRFKRQAKLPLLRKDFIIDEAQLYEARANGADAILLIAAALTDDFQFSNLHACALSLGLSALVEVHNELEIERALRLHQVNLIGINNRNLNTFDVSLSTTERLIPYIPDNITVVSESGIFTAQDVNRVAAAGAHAILVGEALIVDSNIANKVRELSRPANIHYPANLK